MHAPSNDWAELDDKTLREFSASGVIEITENGEWLAALARLQFEVHVQGKNPLIHLWSDERNLTRRLVRVKSHDENRIVLEVQRFGKSKPGRLEFVRRESARAASHITREQFRERFERILSDRFPDAVVDSLTSSRDLKRSFSGLYVGGTDSRDVAREPTGRDHAARTRRHWRSRVLFLWDGICATNQRRNCFWPG
jgi:hypothetical protein